MTRGMRLFSPLVLALGLAATARAGELDLTLANGSAAAAFAAGGERVKVLRAFEMTQ